MIQWMKKKNRHCDSHFDDSLYSGYYKSFFGITDDGLVYSNQDTDNQDIDYKIGTLTLGEDIQDNMDNYTDSIMTNDNEEDNIKLIIYPGTNHSNANFLYKSIMHEANDRGMSYDIPLVPSDMDQAYNGIVKNTRLTINKEEFYKFIYNNSKK